MAYVTVSDVIGFLNIALCMYSIKRISGQHGANIYKYTPVHDTLQQMSYKRGHLLTRILYYPLAILCLLSCWTEMHIFIDVNNL